MINEIEKTIRECKKEDEKVNKLLNLFNYNSCPIPVVEACVKFGFKVFQDELPKDKHGFIVINKKLNDTFNTSKVIVVNTNDSMDRKRFSVAHELGHYFLDYNPNTTKNSENVFFRAFEKANNSNEPSEKRIDQFAACLLMPEEMFKNKYNAIRRKSGLNYYEIINELSHLFVVPVEAVDKRVREELKLTNG